MPQERIAVIGGGSWATALVKILTENAESIYWYIRNPENIKYLRKHSHNPNYLSSVELDISRISMSDDLGDIAGRCDTLIFAIPSAFLNQTLEASKADLSSRLVFSTIKGMEPEHRMIMSDYFRQVRGVRAENYGVITGPSHSEEVALERLTYLTLACADTEKAARLSRHLQCHYIKTNISDDVSGTEYAAVLKNIFSLAAGIAHGLGYGDNFQAVLVANAAQEMKRFIDTLCPVHRDINTSAYLGDLVVTAYSRFSRNRIFGNMIGKGYSIRSAQLEMNMIAEGYYAVKSVMELNNRYKLDLPIVSAVYNILYEKIAPSIEFTLLTENIS